MSFLTSSECKSKVESLERRVALGAPLALTDDGLVVSAPGEDEDEPWLEPGINEPLGDGGSDLFAAADPAPFVVAAFVEAAPVKAAAVEATPVEATVESAETHEPTDFTESSYPQYTSSTASVTGYAGTGENAPSPGHFRVAVSSVFLGGATPPTSATVTFDLPSGVGYAEPGVDYNGPLTAGSVVVPLDATGSGFKDVQFSAIDDELVENDKAVGMQITGGSNSSGGPVHPGSPSNAFTVLASGDYLARVFERGYEDAPDESNLGCPLNGDEEYIVRLTTDPNDRPVVGKEVQIAVVEGGDEGAKLVIINDQGDEDPTGPVKVKTDSDGKARFTLRGKAVGRVKLTAYYRDDEDKLDGKPFFVDVS